MSKQEQQKLQTSQTAINIYTILDNELTRMHALLQTYLTLPKDPPQYSSAHSSYASSSSHSGMPLFYNRICHIQDLLLQALVSHDEIIQEKVAELALMGNADSETKEK